MTAEQRAADDVVGAAEAAIAAWQRKHAVTTHTVEGRWAAAADASLNNHELEAAQKVLAEAQAKASEAADAADANQITKTGAGLKKSTGWCQACGVMDCDLCAVVGCTATVHATGVVREVLVPKMYTVIR